MNTIEIKLDNGELVHIDIEGTPGEQVRPPNTTSGGIVETGGANRADKAFEDVTSVVTALPDTTLSTFGSSVASFAKSVVGGMRKNIPDEEADLKIEFGASISMKGGFSLVSVGANASVKVTVSTK